MKLEPTAAQLEAIAKVIYDADSAIIADDTRPSWEGLGWPMKPAHLRTAKAHWDIIAPMVLEAAAKECDGVEREFPDSRGNAAECADRIRALKGDSK